VKEDPLSHEKIKKYFLADFWLFLYISIVLYIRTYHAKGIDSGFKTLDLRAFQKSSPKARKTSASKFIKEKLKKF
jgi:hypothetical protein